MKRRESGNSARHARRDGWRAPLLTMLKYCRHKTTPKIVMENTDQRERKIARGRNVDSDSRTAQQFGPRIPHPGLRQDIWLGHRHATEPAGDKVPGRMNLRAFQKTRLARSNQPFSSAVNGLTAWLGVASGRANAAGGGA
jgi:hypothetical protein